MRAILDSSTMKQCDKNTMEHFGMLSAVLMERAALAAAEEIQQYCGNRKANVLIACGTGNNGGDGLALARLLFLQGFEVTVLFPGREEKCTVETKRQLDIAEKYGIRIERSSVPERTGWDIVVDAVFGIGLDRPVGGMYAELLECLNRLPGYKVAVDIASGISADTGAVMNVAFRADLTVTFGFAKIGQLMYPGAEYTGRLLVKNMGIDETSLLDIVPPAYGMEPGDLSLLPVRRADSNKGTYGRLLVFAGSCSMAGAACFCARAAYRCGTGLVQVITEKANRVILQTQIPEAVLTVYDENTDPESMIQEQLARADAVVIGPGLGRSALAETITECVMKHAKVPCVIDADALNILSEHRDLLREHDMPCILTPHPGEMARLTGTSVPEVKENLFSVASCFTNEYDVITVLKDAHTVISSTDGTMYINTTGNNGMATAGSGDVLSGIIGALLAQGTDPQTAAPLGVMIHGMAGDAAAERCGRRALTASDIAEALTEIPDTSDLLPDRPEGKNHYEKI